MLARISIFSDDELEKMLDDPIEWDFMTDPVIAPEGQTINHSSIMKCKAENNLYDLANQVELINPLSKSILFSSELLPNNLFVKIREVLLNQRLDTDSLLYYLRDPISGDFFTHPIVADDGETYEYDELAAWLNNYNNELPSGVKQKNKLDANRYKNLFVTHLIDDNRIQKLIAGELQRQPILDSYAQVCIDGLQAYIDMRANEPKYAGYKCGHPKKVKLQAALDAKRTLEGKLNPYTLFAPHAQQKVKALKQGRLKEYGHEALEIIRQNLV